MVDASAHAEHPVQIRPWPSEQPLLALVVLTALALWVLLVVSVIGIVYAALLGVFFFLTHLVFISHLRGNGVRLGPDQMPELHARVVELARRVGLKKVPDAYLLQMGGTLNALATKFFRSNFIVLYSDLLEACGENMDARDFIVAHELGHIHAGHLRAHWFLLPGLFFPFLGSAYSRAREYTCDRYGFAATGSDRALDGLAILAAGGKHGPAVNRRALVAQRADLNTVWMKIGQWLGTHPPIAHRLEALVPSLAEEKLRGWRPAFGAVAVLALSIALPIAAAVGVAQGLWPQIRAALDAQQGAASVPNADPEARAAAEEGILSLVAAAEGYRASNGSIPADVDDLYEAWSRLHPDEVQPIDPYDGARFGYQTDPAGEYLIWSSGPDPTNETDDLYYSSAQAR